MHAVSLNYTIHFCMCLKFAIKKIKTKAKNDNGNGMNESTSYWVVETRETFPAMEGIAQMNFASKQSKCINWVKRRKLGYTDIAYSIHMQLAAFSCVEILCIQLLLLGCLDLLIMNKVIHGAETYTLGGQTLCKKEKGIMTIKLVYS